jgi:hypothetical protein
MQREWGCFASKCTQNRTVRTHHRTSGAQRWCSRLSWTWAKARSKLGAVVQLCRDGVMPNAARMGSFCINIYGNAPLPHTELDRPNPPPHSGCTKMVFPPRHGCGRRLEEQTRCSGSTVQRRGDAKCNDNGDVSHRNAHRTGPFGPTTALRVRNDDVPDCHGRGRKPEAN